MIKFASFNSPNKGRVYIVAVLFGFLLFPGIFNAAEPVKHVQPSFQSKDVQEILLLIEKGNYKKTITLADRSWTGVRELVASRLASLLSSQEDSGIYFGIDPKSKVVSKQMRKDAMAIVDSILAIKDVKAVPYLLNVTDKELAGHAYVTAFNIGIQQYKTNKAASAETIRKTLRAWEKRGPISAEKKGMVYNLYRPASLRTDTLRYYFLGCTPQFLLELYKESRHWRMKISREIVIAAATDQALEGYSSTNTDKYSKNPMVLLAALSDENMNIRKYAASGLGKLHAHFYWEDDENIQKALHKLLKDKDFSIQVEAALSLASYSSLDGLRYLTSQDISKLLHVSDPNRGGSVCAAIQKMGDIRFTESTPWIIKAGQKNPALKRTCVDALWAMRDPTAFEFLGKIVLDKNETTDLRTHTLFPLARSMDNKAFLYIKKAYAEAVKAKNSQMISSCLAAMGDIHPDLSFDILCDALTIYWTARNNKNMSTLQKAYGTAFLQLHDKSGCANVMKQLNDNKAMLKKGMEVYWSDTRRLFNAWDKVRDSRFVKVSPAKENVAWRKLERTVNSLSLPARRRGLQLYEFYWEEMVSRDGSLRIYKKVKDNGLLIIVKKNRTAQQANALDKK